MVVECRRRLSRCSENRSHEAYRPPEAQVRPRPDSLSQQLLLMISIMACNESRRYHALLHSYVVFSRATDADASIVVEAVTARLGKYVS